MLLLPLFLHSAVCQKHCFPLSSWSPQVRFISALAAIRPEQELRARILEVMKGGAEGEYKPQAEVRPPCLLGPIRLPGSLPTVYSTAVLYVSHVSSRSAVHRCCLCVPHAACLYSNTVHLTLCSHASWAVAEWPAVRGYAVGRTSEAWPIYRLGNKGTAALPADCCPSCRLLPFLQTAAYCFALFANTGQRNIDLLERTSTALTSLYDTNRM